MKITINGADADIQTEHEKTVGEVICALDAWLGNTGHCIKGMSINGEAVAADSLGDNFNRSIDTIDLLDISTGSILELFAESLMHTIRDISVYEDSGFDEKRLFAGQWKQSPQAMMLCEQSPELYNYAAETFSGEGTNPQVFRLILEERLRELEDPASEMGKAGSLVNEVCTRLEELPLDIQTGKDMRAAETVRTFSGVAEKVFRIFNVLKKEGFPVEEINVGNIPVTAYITEFSTALRELLAAYEQHDTVLVGDLAEYEMAPRLRGLHNAVLDGITRKEQ